MCRSVSIIDEIEKIRSLNNINWMNIIRIAMKYAPEETKKELCRICDMDEAINKRLKELVTSK